MPQARILVNATPGSNDNVPINVLVQLDNQSLGDETSYTWAILNQPPGTTDVLSSTSAKNPSFTPKKEGTYLVKVTVDLGLPTEQSDVQIVAIRQVKTRERIPAAGETTQDDSSAGWATAMNSLLRRIDAMLSDAGIIVGVAGAGGLSRGTILKAQGGYVIKSGLPGQETVPLFTLSTAATLPNVDELLCAMEGDVSTGGTPALNAIAKARYIGRLANVAVSGGAGGSPGDIIYLDDAGRPSRTQGTIRRQIGSIMADLGGGAYDVWFDGVGGADITPISVGYVLYGAPGAGMTGAKRVDGANAQGSSAGVPWTFISGDNATPSLVAKAKSGQTANIFEAQSSGGIARSGIDSIGNFFFGLAQFAVLWPQQQIYEVAVDRLAFGTTATNYKTFQIQSGSNDSKVEVWGDLAGSVQTALRSSAVGFFGSVGTLTNNDFYLVAQGALCWKLDKTTGDLLSQSGRKIIWGAHWQQNEAANTLTISRVSDSRTAAMLLQITDRTIWGVGSTDSPVTVSLALDANPGTGRAGVMSLTDVPLQFGTNNSYQWMINNATGNLQALSGDRRITNVADPRGGIDSDVPPVGFLGSGRPIRERFASIAAPWASPSAGYPSAQPWTVGSNNVYDSGAITCSTAQAGQTASTNYSLGCVFFLPESGRLLFSFRVNTAVADVLHVYIDSGEVMAASGFSPARAGLFVSGPLRAGVHYADFLFARSGGAPIGGQSCAITDVSVLTEGEFRAAARGVDLFQTNWKKAAAADPNWTVTATGFTYETDNPPGKLHLIGTTTSADNIEFDGAWSVVESKGGSHTSPGFGFFEAAALFDLAGWGASGVYMAWIGLAPSAGGKGAYLNFYEGSGTGGPQADFTIGEVGGVETVIFHPTPDYANLHTYSIAANAAGVCLCIDGVYQTSVASDYLFCFNNHIGRPFFKMMLSATGAVAANGYVRSVSVLSGQYPTP